MSLAPSAAYASGGDAHAVQMAALTAFCILVAMHFIAAIGGIVEKAGLPGVVGELALAMVIGNVLRFAAPDLLTTIMDNFVVVSSTVIGVNLLLFQTGVEENLHKMMKVGPRAGLVALVGMVFPVLFGYGLCWYFFPETTVGARLFFGATLAATSVGITARIFKDLNYDGETKSLTVGGAVIDDVGGLILFAVVVAIVGGGVVTGMFVLQKVAIAVAFLVGAILIGRLLAPWLSKIFSSINAGKNMKMSLSLVFCAAFGAAAAWLAGLEPIIGSFAAGLLLDQVHFKKFRSPEMVTKINSWRDMLPQKGSELDKEMQKEVHHQEHGHVEQLIQGPASLFVPIFFVYTGMSVDLSVFLDPKVILIAAAVSVAAIIGKLLCGLVGGKNVNGWILGWAMVARGEVGLIFAAAGHATRVFSDSVFSVLVVVIVVTTFIPPMILPRLIAKEKAKDNGIESVPRRAQAV